MKLLIKPRNKLGKLLLATDKGEPLPHQTSCTITENVTSAMFVEVSFIIDDRVNKSLHFDLGNDRVWFNNDLLRELIIISVDIVRDDHVQHARAACVVSGILIDEGD